MARRAKQPFTAEAAVKAARGYAETATLLEKNYQEMTAGLKNNITLEIINQLMGRIASAIVLQALALELVLKARLVAEGLAVETTHNHAKLFAKLPASVQQEAGQRYQASRHPAMRASLKEALAYSAPVFEQWRYLHEHRQVEASLGEMQHAFVALAHGL
jgi:hypothetical protein